MNEEELRMKTCRVILSHLMDGHIMNGTQVEALKGSIEERTARNGKD